MYYRDTQKGTCFFLSKSSSWGSDLWTNNIRTECVVVQGGQKVICSTKENTSVLLNSLFQRLGHLFPPPCLQFLITDKSCSNDVRFLLFEWERDDIFAMIERERATTPHCSNSLQVSKFNASPSSSFSTKIRERVCAWSQCVYTHNTRIDFWQFLGCAHTCLETYGLEKRPR